MVLEGSHSIFMAGCAGGALAELLHWWGLRQSPQLPAYAKSLLYWFITLAMVLAGGLVAWFYFGNRAEAIIAAHVGLSAPLILQKLVTSIPETEGSRNIVVTPPPTLRRFFTW
ncbi:MAG: hypothetical protein GEV05_12620 [Betaproteobacteria bacterium]|nr:hypothetical protein [Betaproteobacteria bacterium]